MINSDDLIEQLKKKLNIIEEEDIPSIDLYMDQVTTFMEKHLKDSKRFEDDKILTKTMINNYSKNQLLPAPIKKRYSKDHIILLIFIYYLKNILSINDINTLLSPLCDKYYDEDDRKGLSDIYAQIAKLEENLIPEMDSEIKNRIDMAKSAINKEGISDDEKELLTTFSFISTLCFDVYAKKQLIEIMVDSIADKYSDKDKTSKEKPSKDKTTRDKASKDKVSKDKTKTEKK